jgi:hypothetical protein
MDYIKIHDVAEKLNISRMTVYNKLNNKEIYKELKPFLKKIKKVQYMSAEGIEILKKYIPVKDSSKNNNQFESKIDSKDNEFKEMIDSMKDLQVNYISDLKNQVEYLQDQLKNKDEIIKNFQILLKNEQENNLKLLESKQKTIWDKIFKNKKGNM